MRYKKKKIIPPEALYIIKLSTFIIWLYTYTIFSIFLHKIINYKCKKKERGKKKFDIVLLYTCIHLTARENMVLSCRYTIFTLMILLMFYRRIKTIHQVTCASLRELRGTMMAEVFIVCRFTVYYGKIVQSLVFCIIGFFYILILWLFARKNSALMTQPPIVENRECKHTKARVCSIYQFFRNF